MYYKIEEHKQTDPETKKYYTSQVIISKHEGSCPDSDVTKKTDADHIIFIHYKKSITAALTLVKAIYDKK